MDLKYIIMSKHILFNLASRSRPTELKRVIEEIYALSEDKNFTILVKVDNDDPASNYEWLKQWPDVVINKGKSISKIDAIQRGLNEYLAYPNIDIIVDVSDDFHFTRPGFDNIIREHCGEDDFVLFPEPFADGQVVKGKNERIAIMLVMGRKYYERDGFLFHPNFKSLFCDNWATEISRRRGRLKVVEELLFYHAHPAAGYGKPDAQRVKTEGYWDTDKRTYYEMLKYIDKYV